MTGIDTSDEAVERCAELLDQTRLARLGEKDPIAALLRALLAERKRLQNTINDLSWSLTNTRHDMEMSQRENW